MFVSFRFDYSNSLQLHFHFQLELPFGPQKSEILYGAKTMCETMISDLDFGSWRLGSSFTNRKQPINRLNSVQKVKSLPEFDSGMDHFRKFKTDLFYIFKHIWSKKANTSNCHPVIQYSIQSIEYPTSARESDGAINHTIYTRIGNWPLLAASGHRPSKRVQLSWPTERFLVLYYKRYIRCCVTLFAESPDHRFRQTIPFRPECS